MKRILYFAFLTITFGDSIFGINTPFGQLTFFRISILLMLILGIINNRKLLVISKENKYSILFLFFWLSYAILSIAWAKNYSDWAHNVFYLSIAIITISISVRELKTIEDIRLSITAFVFGASIQGVFGWIEIFTGKYYFLKESSKLIIYKKNEFPVAAMGNTNDFATLMLFTCIFSMLLVLMEKGLAIKLFFILSACSCAMLLFLTTSRANIIALLLAIICMLILMGWKYIITIPILICFVMMIPGVSETILQSIHIDVYALSGSDADRIALIKNGLYFLKYSFGFGIGAGQVEYYMLNKAVIPTDGIVNMHNWWMEILTNYGVIIFIGYIIFYCKLLFHSFNKYKRSKDQKEKYLNIILCAILVAFIIGSMSSSSNMSSEYVWMFFAICIVNQGITQKNCNDNDATVKVNLAEKE